MIGVLKDVIENTGVTDLTKNNKCSNCGNCCSNLLPLSKKEIITIKRYIKVHNINESKHIAGPVNAYLDLTCPFLDNSKELKCSIYEVRPKVCRDFSCNHKLRVPFDINFYIDCKPTNVRETFF